MDPVTHALASVTLSRAGFNKISGAATPILLVSGLIADVDWLTRLGSAGIFLRGHRTATHSLLGTAAIAAGVAGAAWLLGRRSARFSIGLAPALLLAAIGAGAHLVLDLLNDYGIKLLSPFSQKWFAWDLAYSVDWWILLFLLAGLLIPELFRLVHEEIVSRPKRDGRRRGAIAGLAFVLLVIGGRAYAHGRAVALLNSREYRGQTPLAVAAFPHSSNPLLWSAVVETDNAVLSLEVPLGLGRAFDPDLAEVHFKPQPSDALKSALASPAALEFLNFARFPLASIEPEGDASQIHLRDMRFASQIPGQRGVIAVIRENAQGFVVGGQVEYDFNTTN